MINVEILPVLSGMVLGCVLGCVHPSRRWTAGAVLAFVLGVLATIASGEFRLSWNYVLVDVPLVAGSAAVTLIAVHRLRWVR